MSRKELAEQVAVYAARIMELERKVKAARSWIEAAHQYGCNEWPDSEGQVSWKPCDCGRDELLKTLDL